MTKRTLKFDYLDELGLTPDQFEAEMRLVIPAWLCKRGAISTGRPAEVAGISKPKFLGRMDELGIPAFDLEELATSKRRHGSRCSRQMKNKQPRS